MEVVLGLWDPLVYVLQGVLREEGGGVPQQVGPIELNIINQGTSCDWLSMEVVLDLWDPLVTKLFWQTNFLRSEVF